MMDKNNIHEIAWEHDMHSILVLKEGVISLFSTGLEVHSSL